MRGTAGGKTRTSCPYLGKCKLAEELHPNTFQSLQVDELQVILLMLDVESAPISESIKTWCVENAFAVAMEKNVFGEAAPPCMAGVRLACSQKVKYGKSC